MAYTHRTFRKGNRIEVATSLREEAVLLWDGWELDTTAADPYVPTKVLPGMELAFAEVRTSVNATTTTVGSSQDLSAYGMQITVDPVDRPYEVRARMIAGHSVTGGVIYARIAEVNNGVDPSLVRIEHKPAGAAGLAPPVSYAYLNPKLRVPATPRARTFRLQWGSMTAGTATLFTPGSSLSDAISNGGWPLEIQAVAL